MPTPTARPPVRARRAARAVPPCSRVCHTVAARAMIAATDVARDADGGDNAVAGCPRASRATMSRCDHTVNPKLSAAAHTTGGNATEPHTSAVASVATVLEYSSASSECHGCSKLAASRRTGKEPPQGRADAPRAAKSRRRRQAAASRTARATGASVPCKTSASTMTPPYLSAMAPLHAAFHAHGNVRSSVYVAVAVCTQEPSSRS
mmetsp:Transcript_26924/g.93448  ORF Transcript_26924/g.93448 Transcript_26924/m.93448 type:complete len:206 (-) Transcript_26924:3317-3934(-)